MNQTPAPKPPTDAAQAFEGLREEISLLRTAIQGLTAAKDNIPDYSVTLRDIASRLGRMEKQIESINEKPAMRLTPLTIAAEINEGLIAYRAEDRKAIEEARDTLVRSLGRVEGMIKQRRSTDEQDWWVTWGTAGGVLGGAFLTLVCVALWV
jgi:hypothetical protein